jgi:hypothetical protein
VLRLQVPATPDPYDDATSESHRRAVLDLLPDRHTPQAAAGVPEHRPEEIPDQAAERGAEPAQPAAQPAAQAPAPEPIADAVPAEG